MRHLSRYSVVLGITVVVSITLMFHQLNSVIEVSKYDNKSDYEHTYTPHSGICDNECQRFRVWIYKWPKSRPKSTIYILVQASRIYLLKRMLHSLDEYFNNVYKYPIVIFSEGDMAFKEELTNSTKSELFFQSVNFTIPLHLPRPVTWSKRCDFPIGYKHMCRFHAYTVYQQPILQGLDYYWRLDDDSLLIKKINYDVFKRMQRQNSLYGYIAKDYDAKRCVIGLWDTVHTYITNKSITTEFFSEWHEPLMYYNNFEISSSSLWLSRKYMNFIEYIDQNGGIYKYRWGDAPIKSIAVSMFVPKIKTYLFPDIGYKHGTNVVKTFNT